MKVALGSDHGGFALKEAIKKHLNRKGIEFVDYGTFNNESVDYPDYGRITAEAVMRGECDRGIAICGTGIGISLAANKVKGIRCALVSEEYSARMAKAHNNANMIAMGGRVVGEGIATGIVDVWLETEFEGGRHERRVEKIMEIEGSGK
ncbi:MAG: ribose 5-phosphate isomerase B [Peptostreptococcaceae bacterium]|nr:ribose 5-phosphate isomerase B [Peptostreptococcaceae bacterium]